MRCVGTIVVVTALTRMASAPPAAAASQHQHPAGPAKAEAVASALSETQARQLLAGEGTGQAAAAEATGYPGPKHVLELAAELKLTAQQRSAVQAIFDRMNADARQLGAQVVQAERELYQAFQSETVTAADIDARTMRIAHLQAQLRARHLKAHLETTPLLNAEQVAGYRQLRGHVP